MRNERADVPIHRLEAGSTPVPPGAGGDKLSPPLGIFGLRAILRSWVGFINFKGGHRPGVLGELGVFDSWVLVVFSTHEAILTQVLKNACCWAT